MAISYTSNTSHPHGCKSQTAKSPTLLARAFYYLLECEVQHVLPPHKTKTPTHLLSCAIKIPPTITTTLTIEIPPTVGGNLFALIPHCFKSQTAKSPTLMNQASYYLEESEV